MEIPLFGGQMKIEEVLDWLTDVERSFDVMEIPDRQKVTLLSIKLKGCHLCLVGANSGSGIKSTVTSYQELARDEEVNPQTI